MFNSVKSKIALNTSDRIFKRIKRSENQPEINYKI